MGRAISESIEQMLWRLGDREQVVFKQEWLATLDRFTPLTDCDSVRQVIDQFVNVKYLVSGTYAPDTAGYLLTVTYQDRKLGTTLKTVTVQTGRRDIFAANRQLAEEAITLFGLRKPRQGLRDLTGSWEAYRAYHQGMAAFRGRQYDQARQHFERALALDTAFAYAHMRLAELGRQQAVRLKPDDESRKKMLESAALRGFKAVQLDNDLADAYTASAWAYVFLERWPEAQAGLEVAYRLQPLQPTVYYLISKMREERFSDFRVKSIYDALEKALAINPVDVEARLLLIDLYNNHMRKQRYSEELNQQLLEFDPRNVEAGLTLSLTYLYQMRYQESITVCRRLLAGDSLAAAAWYNLGLSFLGMGEADSAAVYLLKAAGLGYLNAYNYLAEIYEKKKMYYTAIKYLRRRVAQGEMREYFKDAAAARLYRLVHTPGIVVDSSFEFQRLPVSPSLDSVTALKD
jgi:tetratricopeptide (TPR) repeat protein